jgi:hypothetical protein
MSEENNPTSAPVRPVLDWPVIIDPTRWKNIAATVIGVPYSESYSGEPLPNDQANAPSAIRKTATHAINRFPSIFYLQFILKCRIKKRARSAGFFATHLQLQCCGGHSRAAIGTESQKGNSHVR